MAEAGTDFRAMPLPFVEAAPYDGGAFDDPTRLRCCGCLDPPPPPPPAEGLRPRALAPAKLRRGEGELSATTSFASAGPPPEASASAEDNPVRVPLWLECEPKPAPDADNGALAPPSLCAVAVKCAWLPLPPLTLALCCAVQMHSNCCGLDPPPSWASSLPPRPPPLPATPEAFNEGGASPFETPNADAEAPAEGAENGGSNKSIPLLLSAGTPSAQAGGTFAVLLLLAAKGTDPGDRWSPPLLRSRSRSADAPFAFKSEGGRGIEELPLDAADFSERRLLNRCGGRCCCCCCWLPLPFVADAVTNLLDLAKADGVGAPADGDVAGRGERPEEPVAAAFAFDICCC